MTRAPNEPEGFESAQRRLWGMTGVNGFLAVTLGAFGAHALETWLGGSEDAARRLAWWYTATQYHLVHALALACTASLAQTAPRPAGRAGLCFQCGILLFSGSLYTMTLTGWRWLGAVTPFGGMLLLVGWMAVAFIGFRWRR